METEDLRIIIVGAGVAGITAAAKLRDAGVNSVVFEKSRGVGGRMSTRQTRNGYQFDHGAQFFTVRSSDFRNEIEVGQWADRVASWQPEKSPISVSSNRYVGVPMMKQPTVAIADDLNVQTNTRIENIQRVSEKWILSVGEHNEPIHADIVILAIPSVQAQALTPFSPQLEAELAKVTMEPCWSLMAAFDQQTGASFASMESDTAIFSWMAKNSSKPGRDPKIETWVAHANPSWSDEYLELDEHDAISRLLPSFLEHMPHNCPAPIYIAAHRWRYARVAQAANMPFLSDETNTLYAIGDWCLGPRVECAYESGHRVAEQLLSTAQ